MKKALAILLLAILCISVCSCGKTENMIAAEDAIKAIGEVTLESESMITAAEKAVDALNAEEKEKFKMGDKLDDARAKYDELVENEKVSEVIKLIDSLGDITFESGKEVDAAQKAYDKLSNDGKSKVTNKDVLENAQKILDDIRIAEKERIINEKTPLFEVEYDKMEDITWYQPKSMPNYIDVRSYIIPYIGKSGNNSWICIRYNYTADDWIFWENMNILVDGHKYYKHVGSGNTVRDNDTEVWEWYDEVLDYNIGMDDSDLMMLKAIAESEETIIRFQGDEYHYDLTVTDTDKKAIADTLALYEAFTW